MDEDEREKRRKEVLTGLNKFLENMRENEDEETTEKLQQAALLKVDDWLDKSNGEITLILREMAGNISRGSSLETKSTESRKNKSITKLIRIINRIFAWLKKTLSEQKKNIKIELTISKRNKTLQENERALRNNLHNLSQKILRRFDYNTIRALARINQILDTKTIVKYGKRSSYTKVVKKTFEDYISEVPSTVSTEDILCFAEKRGTQDSHEFRSRLDEIRGGFEQNKNRIINEYSQKVATLKGLTIPITQQIEQEPKQCLFDLVVKEIKEFEPKANYYAEAYYHQMLFGWLERTFRDDAKIEEQIGSSRPDITIRNIGIEVKGPTYDTDLQTIADKLLRYPQFFKGGIIVVLFDVHVYERKYNEWLTGLKTTYPNVVVIRK